MEYKIRIYQVKPAFLREYGYRAYKEMVRDFHEPRIRRDVYDLAWEGVTYKTPNKDQLYLDFNLPARRPKDYTGRSMSVSDVLEFPDLDELWYCDSLGWKRVEWKEGEA